MNANPDRFLIRAADRARTELHNQSLVVRQTAVWELEQLIGKMEQLQVTARRWHLSLERRWLAAANQQQCHAGRILRGLPRAITNAGQVLARSCRSIPSPSEVVRELNSLKQEFGDLRVRDQTVAVTTEAIVLEGVGLGPFEIRLRLSALADPVARDAFEVTALEPNPAASDPSVVHPHVQGSHLCFGDAYCAVHASLTEGRIADAFLLVRSVLQTYNPESPYVSLENWEGSPCNDCAETVNSDEACWCESCEGPYCEMCISMCSVCEELRCRECLESCPLCEEPGCPGCLKSCKDCGQPLCETCRDDAQCPCHEEPEEDLEHEGEEHNQTTPDAGVGEPARDPIRRAAAATS